MRCAILNGGSYQGSGAKARINWNGKDGGQECPLYKKIKIPILAAKSAARMGHHDSLTGLGFPVLWERPGLRQSLRQ